MDTVTSTILAVAGFIITVSTALGIITSSVKKFTTKLNDSLAGPLTKNVSAEIMPAVVEIKEKLNNMEKYVADNKIKTDNFIINICKERLYQTYRYYIAPEHIIDDHVMSIIDDLFEQYHDRGGNGQIAIQWQSLKDKYKTDSIKTTH